MRKTARRVVILPAGTSKGRFGGGRSPTLFAYGWEQIAQLWRCSIERAQHCARERSIDPADLPAVCREAQRRTS